MRILCATDGSRGAAIAEDFLLSLPLSRADDVTVLTAPTTSEREAYALLSRCRWRFATRNVPSSTVMRAGRPADVVAEVALERASELIVIGSRGFGTITGALLGSMARALVRSAPAPVLIVRARREAPRQILLAIDGSADARVAVDLVGRMPLPGEARLTLVRIAADGDDVGSALVVRRARAILGERIVQQETIDAGHVGEQVLRIALQSHSDVIVLGSDGQTVGTGLLGSCVADHVVSHARCAVLVARSVLRPLVVESRAPARAILTH